ncbi:thiosulfate/3-mercaptopyruvate sulfurtransferase [Franzmannia pantelleriensis]|uniref:Thiosulfate/3-mercaptopyruvate sulfurtransferase n=1 Tax=Franzmannia pantelleriensis TaxID=48727 RepID=A0A1G9NTY4_9GAMM|nr:sulfurtransferase [Halomonas pantelleriensis]SDL89801.1 thiosulfate/3-mercaptopyruvate sulfurtransferase [Halomonas pantelleriensis]
MRSPLMSAAALQRRLATDVSPLLLDCRARLNDTGAGRALWRQASLPGSLHLDLDRDLAAAPGQGGRHPLPSRQAFTDTLQRLGVAPSRPLVVFDDMGGQLAAARAWWMLACWAGHPGVQVLDGGLPAWEAAGGALAPGDDATIPSEWRPAFDDSTWVDADEVFSGRALKLDARSPARFRGEQEPIDPVAGHIPGARCRPSATNLDETGLFKSPERLAAELPRADELISYCGSGVTACHTILAYAVADLPLPRLYAGSWSGWIEDPTRPVARGD